MRQAPILFDNLRAALGAGNLRRYRPQRDYLKLVSAGGRVAVAEKYGLAAEGAWMWRLKDRIDRRFMAMLNRPPTMPPLAAPAFAAAGLREELGGGQPLCAGCGAKVGAQALRTALTALPAPARADLVAGPGDDAAILRHGAGYQVVTTDHLPAVTQDPWLMARIAAVHALGDIWAMGATPQIALASVTLPRASAALQARMLAEVLDGAAGIFAPEGAEVAGGHTTQGAALAIGFTVTGLAERVLTKGGAKPGDALVLTRPLGTGLLMAAAMAGQAPPRAVAAAWTAMATPQGAAARLLAPHARAMTDVTGFGLAGHLWEMAEAAGLSARLRLSAVPLLPGVAALAAAGRASTLAPANRAALDRRITVPAGAADGPLFDPQTSGGLLAAVPPASAEAVIVALHGAGFAQAAIIGTFEAGPPAVRVAP